jgi:hypothetical protein
VREKKRKGRSAQTVRGRKKREGSSAQTVHERKKIKQKDRGNRVVATQ